MTNAEKICSMSNDELADFLSEMDYEGACNGWLRRPTKRTCDGKCVECIKIWLNEEEKSI